METFFPVVVDAIHVPVSTRLRRRTVGSFAMTKGYIQHREPIRGSRAASSIRQRADDQFVLITPKTGKQTFRQFGRSATLDPGRSVLLDTRVPYDFERHTTGAFTCHQIPGEVLRRHLRDPEPFCAVPIDSGRGAGAIVLRYLEAVWAEVDELSEDESGLLLANAAQLLPAALGLTDQQRVQERPGLYARALNVIEQNLKEQGFGACELAAELDVSPSHLHATFQKRGTTIGRTIRDIRLDRCRQDLLQGASVTDTAYRWGFSDASHFSRTFKSKFGAPPRQVRDIGSLPG